jgi:hypothetical protein
MTMNRRKLLQAMALACAVAPLAAGCASEAQLREIAEKEGITIEEARRRQLAAANDVDEAIPGVGNAFLGEYGGGDY